MNYKIKVHPNSKQEKIEEKEDFLEIYTKEPARENKANNQVIKLLSKYFKVTQSQIKLKALKSRIKYIEIQ
jgi:uncharacterized protein YggU (UPF0235/DUF167 family)